MRSLVDIFKAEKLYYRALLILLTESRRIKWSFVEESVQ